jgi:hypothetical protein
MNGMKAKNAKMTEVQRELVSLPWAFELRVLKDGVSNEYEVPKIAEGYGVASGIDESWCGILESDRNMGNELTCKRGKVLVIGGRARELVLLQVGVAQVVNVR